jgi:hypothetical protein
MNHSIRKPIDLLQSLLVAAVVFSVSLNALAQVGVGTNAPKDAEVLFDGSRKMLDEKWTYWQGPRLAASLPIKWAIEKDPAGSGTVMNTNDPSAAGGKYGGRRYCNEANLPRFPAPCGVLREQTGRQQWRVSAKPL